MEQNIFALMLWISATMGWAMPNELPKIARMSPEIQAKLMGTPCVSFLPSLNTVFICERSNDPSDKIHELVHVFQYAQGRIARTSKEECLLELEAEEVENKWRIAYGWEESRPYQKLCGFVKRP